MICQKKIGECGEQLPWKIFFFHFTRYLRRFLFLLICFKHPLSCNLDDYKSFFGHHCSIYEFLVLYHRQSRCRSFFRLLTRQNQSLPLTPAAQPRKTRLTPAYTPKPNSFKRLSEFSNRLDYSEVKPIQTEPITISQTDSRLIVDWSVASPDCKCKFGCHAFSYPSPTFFIFFSSSSPTSVSLSQLGVLRIAPGNVQMATRLGLGYLLLVVRLPIRFTLACTVPLHCPYSDRYPSVKLTSWKPGKEVRELYNRKTILGRFYVY